MCIYICISPLFWISFPFVTTEHCIAFPDLYHRFSLISLVIYFVIVVYICNPHPPVQPIPLSPLEVHTFVFSFHVSWWALCTSVGKSICLQCGRPGFSSWGRKIPWRRKWQPTPLFLPEESQGQRSLAGYSSRDHKSWTWLSATFFLGFCVSISVLQIRLSIRSF